MIGIAFGLGLVAAAIFYAADRLKEVRNILIDLVNVLLDYQDEEEE